MSQVRTNSIVPVGGIPAGASGGGIVQVVSFDTPTFSSSATSSFADTALITSITPRVATNKILVIMYCGMCNKTGADTQLNLKILRGATTVFEASSLNNNINTAVASNPTLVFLDSPATTSSTTYKLQLANRDNVGTVSVNVNGTATVLLLEVSA